MSQSSKSKKKSASKDQPNLDFLTSNSPEAI